MTLKQGQVITHSLKMQKHTVLDVLSEIVFLSQHNNPNKVDFMATESELRDLGYTWDEKKFVPIMEQGFWFIDDEGDESFDTWEDSPHQRLRRDFLGIYETREKAQAALADIKRKLKV